MSVSPRGVPNECLGTVGSYKYGNSDNASLMNSSYNLIFAVSKFAKIKIKNYLFLFKNMEIIITLHAFRSPLFGSAVLLAMSIGKSGRCIRTVLNTITECVHRINSDWL